MNYLERAQAAGIELLFHCAEIDHLVELASGKEVLEIGSYKGGSTWAMSHTAKSVLSVDTFSAATDGQRQEDHRTTLEDYLKAVGHLPNVKHFIGTSKEASESDEVANDFDLIFIDAMHTYEAVKEDISLWWPRVRPGGYLVLHDYGADAYPGVKQAADEVFGPAEPAMRVIRKPCE